VLVVGEVLVVAWDEVLVGALAEVVLALLLPSLPPPPHPLMAMEAAASAATSAAIALAR
jgi:hypothetical protein